MQNLSLFDGAEAAPEFRVRLASRLRELAREHIFLGASSWKYEGWLGAIYTASRYQLRGRFSEKKFLATCLAEYAETFPIVCGDFSFYQFPSAVYWQGLFSAAPGLQFAFKVPEEITVKRWPQHARYGSRAGLENPSFLNADLFRQAFHQPLEPWMERVAVLIFEFGAFPGGTFDGAGFAAVLDRFLAALPAGVRYGVEIRNPELLGPEYLGCLRRHNVAHVVNAWTRMPAPTVQLNVPGIETADFLVSRALLRPGRTYEQAVKQFSPYRHVQEPNEDVRAALRRMIRRARERRIPAYLFVNNRLEGFAPGTIEAIIP